MATPLILATVPVFYATSEGQTRRIATRFAATLRTEGIEACAYDVSALEDVDSDWRHVRGAIVGASIHAGRHQRTAHAFASQHSARLNAVPSIFFSVSLSAASQNRDEVDQVQKIAEAFPVTCSWRPDLVISLAGRLAYTQFNVVTRFFLKRIARKEGAPVDTSRDYEFTDWNRVDGLAREFAGRVRRRAAA